MDESIYNEEMDGIYRMIRSGEYTSAIDKMMVGDGFRLDAVYKFDANHSWYVLGGIFLKIGNYNSAIESFRRSLKSWPEDVDALMAMGNIYSEIKKYKMAERFFRRGLLINPENLGMKFNLANALFDQGKLDLALKEYASIARQESDLSGQANRMIGLINQKARKTTRTRP
ncbi:tetratricopeptide repeat protein [Vandammella animalimorsus]|nr:tetratricopeptide repeat protein [Vandammella animalimorsus]